jgi:ABC-type phosphate/phosphonate transport system permease subunit
MSAWERARSLPWERLPRDADSVEIDEERERLFRRLQRENVEHELLSQEAQLQGADDGSGDGTTAAANKLQYPRYQFSGMQMLRMAAFGGTLGSITGGVFGFMDGMRTAGESSVLTKASTVAQGRYMWESTSRSATLFGVFFMAFQMGKYGIRVVANDPGDAVEIAGSGVLTLGGLLR